MDFWEDMAPITSEPGIADRIEGRDFGSPPIFVMHSSLQLPGSDLGIRVKKSWWTKVKDSCPPPFSEKEYEATGEVEIILATLSYRDFDLYWKPVDWNGAGCADYIYKTLPRLEKRRNEQREKLGWTAEKHGGFDFTPDCGWPETLHHKYFEVVHRHI
jgi:hypothetical protein